MNDQGRLIISARKVGKVYRLFERPADRLKEALHPFGRCYHADFVALADIDLEVRSGESLAIIGRNGSGKSTLLKMITGVISPTSGALETSGRIAALLELGAGFNPELSGIDNVRMNGEIMGLSPAAVAARLEEILSFADIGAYAARPCREYSSGMFARLAFAAMIHFEPDILIVDEALAVGDVFFQQKCFRWMKEHMAGVTKLLVTHDMVSVAQLATRAVVIERGRKVFDGEPHAAIEHYTKAAHTEAFSKSAPASSTREAEAPSLPTSTSLRAIPESSLGGGRELDICAFSVTVDDAPVELVRAGERVVVAMALFAKRSFDSVIVGVTVSDKYGQAIFGVNSLGSGHDSLAIRVAGGLRVELSFVWPEIKEGTYLLTLGVGEGVEELSHVVQCWAHNVTSVAALPGRAVHGIFNVHMDEVSLSPTTGEH